MGASDSFALSVLTTSLDATVCTLCSSHPSLDLLIMTLGATGSLWDVCTVTSLLVPLFFVASLSSSDT